MTTVAVPAFKGKYFRLWQPMWATDLKDIPSAGDMTQMGSDYEVLVFHHQQTTSITLDDVKTGAASAGHEVACVFYVNGTYAPAGSTPASAAYRLKAYAASDVSASPYLTDGGVTWLMDPRLNDWKFVSPTSSRSVPDEANNRRTSGFAGTQADGYMIDNLGWGIIQQYASGYNQPTDASGNRSGTGLSPPNPHTGNPYNTPTNLDEGQWDRWTVGLAVIVRGTYGRDGSGNPLGLYVNGASSGSRWFDPNVPTSVLAYGAMLCMFEGWIRDAKDSLTVFPGGGGGADSEAGWRSQVNAVIDAQNKGRGALTWTKMWAPHNHIDDIACTVDPATDIFTATAHGYSTNTAITLTGSTTTPGGTSSPSQYFVQAPTANTFKVSSTSGGSIINITSAGTSVKSRRVISENIVDDNDSNVVKWHRLAAASFMLGTNGSSFYHWRHDQADGGQRIPQDTYYAHLNALGAPTQSFTTGIASLVSAVDTGANTFTVTGHGFIDDQKVLVENLFGVMPVPFVLGTPYYVKVTDADTIQLAASSGGAAINITAADQGRTYIRSYDGSTGSNCGIGAAQGTSTSANVYARTFQHGVVLVNPTGAGTNISYVLPAGTYKDVDAATYSGTITVPASKTGMMLVDVNFAP